MPRHSVHIRLPGCWKWWENKLWYQNFCKFSHCEKWERQAPDPLTWRCFTTGSIFQMHFILMWFYSWRCPSIHFLMLSPLAFRCVPDWGSSSSSSHVTSSSQRFRSSGSWSVSRRFPLIRSAGGIARLRRSTRTGPGGGGVRTQYCRIHRHINPALSTSHR